MPDDLHARLTSSLRARLEVARAATPGPWTVGTGGILAEAGCRGRVLGVIGAHNCRWPSVTDSEHIAANDPAVEICRVEALLRVVERHRPRVTEDEGVICAFDHGGVRIVEAYPCPDIRDLAAGEGIEVGDG